jgi:hypothetical protein
LNYVKLIYAIITLLPKILDFLKKVEKDLEDEDIKRQREKDREAIKDAFKTKDANKLRAVFNNERVRDKAKSDQT